MNRAHRNLQRWRGGDRGQRLAEASGVELEGLGYIASATVTRCAANGGRIVGATSALPDHDHAQA